MLTLRAQGISGRDAGPTGEAESCFLQAIEIARRQRARWFELRAAASLSRLWADQGNVKEAHALLSGVYAWFTEGFDTADLKEAKSLIEELETRTRGGRAASRLGRLRRVTFEWSPGW